MTAPSKKAAFEVFVREYQAELRSFVRMLGVRSDSVDDLAQEVFLTAYSKLDRFDETRDMGKWIRGVARNKVMNEVSKASRRMKLQNEALYAHLKAMSEEDQCENLFHEEHHHALKHCLKKLPEKSQAIVTRYYGEDLKSGQIASSFQMSAGAVRLALMRIRQSLKHCIQSRIQNV